MILTVFPILIFVQQCRCMNIVIECLLQFMPRTKAWDLVPRFSLSWLVFHRLWPNTIDPLGSFNHCVGTHQTEEIQAPRQNCCHMWPVAAVECCKVESCILRRVGTGLLWMTVWFFWADLKQQSIAGSGSWASGVIVSDTGYILTVAHALHGAQNSNVTGNKVRRS